MQAVPGRDFPVIQAGVFVFAVVFVAINLIVDVLYTVADPAGAADVSARAPPRRRPRCAGAAVHAIVGAPSCWPRSRPPWRPADPIKNSLLDRLTPPTWAGARRSIRSAPTRSAATWRAGCSTARACRSWSGFSAVLLAGVVGVALGLVSGWYAAGSTIS